MKISEPWCGLQLRLSAPNVLRSAHLVGRLLPHAMGGWRRRKYRRYFAAYLEKTGSQGDPDSLFREYCLNLPLQSSSPFLVTKGREDVFRTLVEASGFEHVTNALAAGRGAITVSTHFGRPSLIPAYLSRMGVKTYTIRRRELSRYEGTDAGT